jgi:hypothetical protein
MRCKPQVGAALRACIGRQKQAKAADGPKHGMDAQHHYFSAK